ncbi:hypothetical protein CsatB_017681 [Cannabis sativa]|uniref:uncharacterized protein LOC133036185 n=1 Tax=Cannabis sativa TaxID=3483 RepID=UPI0029C9F684|nr:uncharacterized protein LOC133036185 [Cannabis sativa]
MTEAAKISRVTEDRKLSAILGGIEVIGELWKDIRKNGPVDLMSDFLDRAEGFITLEELPHYPSNSSSNGKRSSNNNRQGNGKKGKFTSKTEKAPRENQAKYTAFTILTEDIESVYMATQPLASYKKPAPMKKDVSKRDMTKFCKFHGYYGHDTNECNNLKREIEFLIRKNNPHVQKYVMADQNQRGDNNQDLLPPPVDGHLQVIIGGPHIAGDSGKAQESYARTAQYEQEEVILAIEERKPKIPRAGDPTITFNNEDAVKIRFPHNDRLVVEVQIANKIVARTMIDNGSSSNILFQTAYEKMGIQLKDLTPCLMPAYGFSGQGVTPLGQIRLPLTVGQAPMSITIMA